MVSDMVMIVSHNMHNNHKLESCHSHAKKQFHDLSMTFWEIFIFQDFSMTTIFSRIFHDRGNPAILWRSPFTIKAKYIKMLLPLCTLLRHSTTWQVFQCMTAQCDRCLVDDFMAVNTHLASIVLNWEHQALRLGLAERLTLDVLVELLCKEITLTKTYSRTVVISKGKA